jgi:hypothetical protein
MNMRVWSGTIAAALLSAGGLFGPAFAQPVFMLPMSEALACLTPAAGERGRPEYDPELLKRKDGGRVEVELSFADAKSAPGVRFLGPATFTGLTDAVKAHVQKFRVPCLPAGAEPARIILTFDFIPNDGRKVMAWSAVDAPDPAKVQLHQCVTRIAGPERPDYPMRAREQDSQGTFLVRLTFASATAAPEVTIVDGPRDFALRDSLKRFSADYRLPCMTDGPVSLTRFFTFKLEGSARTFVKDLTLQQFLGAVTGLPQQVYFDTSKMGCPFDVRVEHRQPYYGNWVGELGDANPARKPLLDWISSLQLRVTPPHRILGDEFTVSVPCAIIDL